MTPGCTWATDSQGTASDKNWRVSYCFCKVPPIYSCGPSRPFRHSRIDCEIERVLLEAEIWPALVYSGDVLPKRCCALDAFTSRQVDEDNVVAHGGHDRVHVVAKPARSVAFDEKPDVAVGHAEVECASSRRPRRVSRDSRTTTGSTALFNQALILIRVLSTSA